MFFSSQRENRKNLWLSSQIIAVEETRGENAEENEILRGPYYTLRPITKGQV